MPECPLARLGLMGSRLGDWVGWSCCGVAWLSEWEPACSIGRLAAHASLCSRGGRLDSVWKQSRSKQRCESIPSSEIPNRYNVWHNASFLCGWCLLIGAHECKQSCDVRRDPCDVVWTETLAQNHRPPWHAMWADATKCDARRNVMGWCVMWNPPWTPIPESWQATPETGNHGAGSDVMWSNAMRCAMSCDVMWRG